MIISFELLGLMYARSIKTFSEKFTFNPVFLHAALNFHPLSAIASFELLGSVLLEVHTQKGHLSPHHLRETPFQCTEIQFPDPCFQVATT